MGAGRNPNCHASRHQAERLGHLLGFLNGKAFVGNFGDVKAKALDHKLPYPLAVAKAATFSETLVCVRPQAVKRLNDTLAEVTTKPGDTQVDVHF